MLFYLTICHLCCRLEVIRQILQCLAKFREPGELRDAEVFRVLLRNNGRALSAPSPQFCQEGMQSLRSQGRRLGIFKVWQED